jgi:4-diphosphocytidyl-2-C-methyl-D-erythritol kinase
VSLALARVLVPDLRLCEIFEACSDIGADVPFCVAALARTNPGLGYANDPDARSSALCEGIGDRLSPVSPESGWAVLVRPNIEVSTPCVYSGWDDIYAGPERSVVDDGNDLTKAAVKRYPLIGDILNEVERLTQADRVFMTGSGPTIVALYQDEPGARSGCSDLEQIYKDRADVDAIILSKLL